ncbi:MAG: IS1634 family transposase [Alphaproteobacteria bacterium]
MYIEAVPNRNSRPAILLREGWREGKRVRKRTLANLTAWPAAKVDALRRVLRGEGAGGPAGFEILRSRPHGHVAAVVGTLRKLRLPQRLARRRSRPRDVVAAMICARVLAPQSKLATARGLADETLFSSLGETLGVAGTDADELYAALDWLVARQPTIEQALAAAHLAEGTLVLYDVTSTYFEGRRCPLGQLGHSRDGKRHKLQIIFGLLCSADGCPVAVEVFDGNVGDPTTVAPQVQKVRERFGVDRVVWVGDRGMITEARIREDLRPIEGLSWITALRAPAIRTLVNHQTLQLSLFDEQDWAEITTPDYPGERLIVCRNPLVAAERRRKREALLQATEHQLDQIVQATTRPTRRLRGKAQIGLRVGKVLGKYNMAKHFQIVITDDRLRYARNTERIATEAALDGFYVIRTNVPAQSLTAEETVRAYKGLCKAERAFRSCKTVDLKVRPIYHRLADRVRAHVFLCMLAYYVEWHMRQALAPILFDDADPAAAAAARASVIRPAQRSPTARAKAARKRTRDDYPVHSFQTLLQDLATLTKNRIQPDIPGARPFDQLTRPTPVQQRAFDLLGVTYRM